MSQFSVPHKVTVSEKNMFKEVIKFKGSHYSGSNPKEMEEISYKDMILDVYRGTWGEGTG